MSDVSAIPFKELLDALLDDTTVLNPRYLYRLSDLEGEELELMARTWPQISARRRLAMMEDLEDLTERDLLLSYEAISRVAVQDSIEQIRLPAVRILWEFDSPSLVPLFMDLCVSDPAAEVRSCATTALGRFVYLGEVDELPKATLRAIEVQLLEIMSGDDQPLVRRRALESLGYSSHKRVPALIELAYMSEDEDWLASALFAMGRSVDERWSADVLDMLEHVNPRVRLEAARAAGELEIDDAVPQLLDLLEDGDEQIRNAAIWSLSQIGGEGVRPTLESMLEEAEGDLEAEFLSDALDNLNFTEGFESFALFDFSEEDLDISADELDDEDLAD